MRMTTLLLAVMTLPNIAKTQDFLYRETHRETCYHYGIVEDGKIDSLTPIERMKFSMTFSKQRKILRIDKDYSTTKEQFIDSISTEKNWMNLAHHFIRSAQGVVTYDQNGKQLRMIPATNEQMQADLALRETIMKEGYHPGMPSFPEVPEMVEGTFADPVRVMNYEDGSFAVISADRTTTFDPNNKLVRSDYRDKDGNPVVTQMYYREFIPGKGLFPSVYKTERRYISTHGPCVTEVNMTIFSDYSLQDVAHLIDKKMQLTEVIELSPNPNDGRFTVRLTADPSTRIEEVMAVHSSSGAIYPIPVPSESTFAVDLGSIPSGVYTLRVRTNHSSIIKHFIKN